MAKKPCDEHTQDAPFSKRTQQASSGEQDKGNGFRSLRLAELIEADPSALSLEDLRTLHFFARQVIGPNLVQSGLDDATLVKLTASVERQAHEARHLRSRLAEASADAVAQAEVRDLSDFLDDALLRLRHQLQTRQKAQVAASPQALPLVSENDRSLAKMVGLSAVVGVLIWAAILWRLWRLLS